MIQAGDIVVDAYSTGKVLVVVEISSTGNQADANVRLATAPGKNWSWSMCLGRLMTLEDYQQHTQDRIAQGLRPATARIQANPELPELEEQIAVAATAWQGMSIYRDTTYIARKMKKRTPRCKKYTIPCDDTLKGHVVLLPGLALGFCLERIGVMTVTELHSGQRLTSVTCFISEDSTGKRRHDVPAMVEAVLQCISENGMTPQDVTTHARQRFEVNANPNWMPLV